MTEKPSNPLDEADVKVILANDRSSYRQKPTETEGKIKKLAEDIKKQTWVKEIDTGLVLVLRLK